MSVMARCAATPRICESAKEVTACTIVAAPAASAIGSSSSVRCLPTTSSISHLELAGRTSPARRLISIKHRPSVSRFLCTHSSSRASRHASDAVIFFFLSASAGTGPTSRLPDRSPVGCLKPKFAAM